MEGDVMSDIYGYVADCCVLLTCVLAAVVVAVLMIAGAV